MNLQRLRDYVANVLDYDPDNPTYRSQVAQLLNDAHDRIVSDKPWPWAQKEAKVVAHADATAQVAVTANSANVSTVNAFFESWMEGNILELDGVEYEVALVIADTNAVLTALYAGTTGTVNGVAKERYLAIPQDCIALLQVIRRVDSRSPEDPGRLVPLTRYEDEWANLPLDEVNLPAYFVPADTTFTPAPRTSGTLGTAVAPPGRGTRTVEVVVTHVFADGRESGPSAAQSITLTDTQFLTVTLGATLNQSGLRRRVYLRDTTRGLVAYRLLQNTAGDTEVSPTGGTFTYEFTSNELDSPAYTLKQRLENNGGTTQRIRLYPRQDRDYTFTVRYLRRASRLEDDQDTPDLPSAHHVALAYRALEALFLKHDNPAQSQLYARRAERELLAMEGRYLTEKPRRWVKGFMEPGLLDRVPQFTQLRRT
jgi:hypothetical protein